MRVIGITGSIACGKSTVSREMMRRGFPVIDALVPEIPRTVYAVKPSCADVRGVPSVRCFWAERRYVCIRPPAEQIVAEIQKTAVSRPAAEIPAIRTVAPRPVRTPAIASGSVRTSAIASFEAVSARKPVLHAAFIAAETTEAVL